jgi:hypothetical protein
MTFSSSYAMKPATLSIMTLVQPDGKTFKVYGFPAYGDDGSYSTKKEKFPVVKGKDGYYYLGIINPKPKRNQYGVLYYDYRPSTVRADSPHAIKKKINGKWHFFIAGTNKEVSYDTRNAILPDWPSVSSPPDDTRLKLYFTGKFKPDGSPIYYPVEKKKTPYRTPFVGSTDFWFLLIPFLLLWKRKIW